MSELLNELGEAIDGAQKQENEMTKRPNKKPTNMQLQYVIDNLLRDVGQMMQRLWALDTAFAAYLDMTGEAKDLQKFIQERNEEQNKEPEVKTVEEKDEHNKTSDGDPEGEKVGPVLHAEATADSSS